MISDINNSITTVVINFNTSDLLKIAYRQIRKLYPELPLLIIDNGSTDNSVVVLEKIEIEDGKKTNIIKNRTNLHHGPAMDQAIKHAQSDCLLFIDTDCQIIKNGLIEKMYDVINQHSSNYAVGHRVYMNSRGFEVEQSEIATPYIRPYCMLIKKDIYLSLPSFIRHGAPCLDNMRAANEKKFLLINFPVLDFVEHTGRGTASRYGYRLGMKGKINHLLNKLGI